MSKQILSEEFKRMQKLAGLINESQLNEDEVKTLQDILKEKGNLDNLKNDRIRLKLITPTTSIPTDSFLKKNPDWKDKLLKFLFYDARSGMVGIELIGSGKSGNAYPNELIIDTTSTNMMENF